MKPAPSNSLNKQAATLLYTPELFANKLCEMLSQKNNMFFRAVRVSEGYWIVSNMQCSIELSFDRFEDDEVVISVKNPNARFDAMGIYLLSFLRKATIELEYSENPLLYVVTLLSDYFMDILRGNFAIQVEYNKICREFYWKMLRFDTLPLEHPARAKEKNRDISILEDL